MLLLQLLLLTFGLLGDLIFAGSAFSRPRPRPKEAFFHHLRPGLAAVLDGDPRIKEETVGKVSRLFVYPIKSCRGHEYGPGTSLDILTKGFKYDRHWVIFASREEGGEGEKLSLREDPRLTWINTHIDEEKGVLRIEASKLANVPDLETLEIPLQPSAKEFESWQKVEVEMWGDSSHGRAVDFREGAVHKWFQDFLDKAEQKNKAHKEWHHVQLIQHDPSAGLTRRVYEPWKPAHDVDKMKPDDKKLYLENKNLAFQDEYQLHITTESSLHRFNEAMIYLLQNPEKDREGLKLLTDEDRENWKDFSTNEKDEMSFKMELFRPNIVIEGDHYAFAEDSWDMVWLGEESQGRHAKIGAISRCKRCGLIYVDPISSFIRLVPMKVLDLFHHRVKKIDEPDAKGAEGACFGMMFRPLRLDGKVMSIEDEAEGDEHQARIALEKKKRKGKGILYYGENSQQEELENEKSEPYEKLGAVAIGDTVRARWRPLSEDDEVFRIHAKETIEELYARAVKEKKARKERASTSS